MIVLLLRSLILVGCLGVELDLDIRPDGSFVLLRDKTRWFESSSFGYVNDRRWISSDGTLIPSGGRLHLLEKIQADGHDIHGAFTITNFTWCTDSTRVPSFITSFVIYSSLPFFVFRQTFPSGASSTAIGDSPDVISAFPTLKTPRNVPLNYLTFADCFCVPELGHWNDVSIDKKVDSFTGGHTTGPVAIYDADLVTLLVSPLRNFMVASQVRKTKSMQSDDFACGIEADIESLPAGFVHETVMYYGQGIAKSLVEWGDFMLRQFGKRRTRSSDESFLTRLSYLTDNGAYYFYHTESPTKTYAETMLDVAQYLAKQRIPVGNVEFDSWWYPKDSSEPRGGGLLIWEPMKSIFPDGMGPVVDGMRDFLGKNLALGLHSRWFSHRNDYLKKMNYSFWVDSGCALPKGKDVWRHMMAKAKGWGLSMYLQDWLIHTYDACGFVRTDLGVGRQWMLDFGETAMELGLTMQYCMPLPLHMLQSLELGQGVTHARASNDYLPVPDLNQWNIGQTSLFYWAIGVVPTKDDFWSTGKWEPNCTFVYCMEPNPEVQAVVAALSFGPVGFSDAMGFEDRDLVMETCRDDGVLLKPDRPLFPLDEVYTASFGMWLVDPMNLWATISCFDDLGFCYTYILSVFIGEAYELTPSMLPYDAMVGDFVSFVAFRWEKGASTLTDFRWFDAKHPLPLRRTPLDPFGHVVFDFWTVVPLVESPKACPYVFLKEMKKIVGSSNERIREFSCVDGGKTLVIHLVGAPSEKGRFAVYAKEKASVLYAECEMSPAGHARIICGQGACSCGSEK